MKIFHIIIFGSIAVSPALSSGKSAQGIIFMALRTEALGGLLGDAPLVRGVANQALVIKRLQMYRMFAALHRA